MATSRRQAFSDEDSSPTARFDQPASGSRPRQRPSARQGNAARVSGHEPIYASSGERSFGEWVVAGFGIAVGMFLFSLAAAIPLGILWAVVLGAALGN